MKIGNFSDMQNRYQMLPLTSRASAVISDAGQASAAVQRILEQLAGQDDLKQAIANLKHNSITIARIRPSEAKTALMDDSINFVDMTAKKLDMWQKILQNIAIGKVHATIVQDNFSQYVTLAGVSGYLAMIMLIIGELGKLNEAKRSLYDSMLGELRRCTTVLSDCECASEFNKVVIH